MPNFTSLSLLPVITYTPSHLLLSFPLPPPQPFPRCSSLLTPPSSLIPYLHLSPPPNPFQGVPPYAHHLLLSFPTSISPPPPNPFQGVPPYAHHLLLSFPTSISPPPPNPFQCVPPKSNHLLLSFSTSLSTPPPPQPSPHYNHPHYLRFQPRYRLSPERDIGITSINLTHIQMQTAYLLFSLSLSPFLDKYLSFYHFCRFPFRVSIPLRLSIFKRNSFSFLSFISQSGFVFSSVKTGYLSVCVCVCLSYLIYLSLSDGDYHALSTSLQPRPPPPLSLSLSLARSP